MNTTGISSASVKGAWTKGAVALAAMFLCGTTAFARTMTVTAVGEKSVELSFGDPDGKAYNICVGYGVTDGGDDKYAWASFVKNAAVVAADATEMTFTLPDAVVSSHGKYRLFLMQTSNLPYQQELTYIESVQESGKNQYIKTGIIGKSGLKVECDMERLSKTGGDRCVLGCVNGSRIYPIYIDANMRLGVGYNGYCYGTKAPVANKRIHVVGELRSGKQTVSFDDTVSYNGTNANEYDTGVEMYLFARNNKGSPDYCSVVRVYNLNIYTNDVPARSFIPVKRANGYGGLCDQVTGGDYGNAGTGSFAMGAAPADEANRRGLVKAMSQTYFQDGIAVFAVTETNATLEVGARGARVLYMASGAEDGGDDKYAWENLDKVADISEGDAVKTYDLPAGKRTGRYARFFLLKTTDLPYDRELAYIGSSGTQYIKTGVTGKNDTKTEGDFASLRNADTSVLASFGNSKRFYAVHLNGSGKWSVGYSGFHAGTIGATLQQRVHVVSELYNGRQSLTINGVTAYSGTEGTCDTGREMFLFTMNYYGNPNYYSQARVYNLAITQNNTLMRKYVPVVANGKGALYDYVSDTVFANQGTGDFALGEAADEANRRGLIKAMSVSFPAGVLVEDDTNNDTQIVTVPADVTFNVSNYYTVEPKLEKRGVGTLVINIGLVDVVSTYTVKAGLLKMGGSWLMAPGDLVAVKDGASFDMAGYNGNRCSVQLEGMGVDGNGALLNSRAEIGNGEAQLSGIELTGDALVKGDYNYGLLASGYGTAPLKLNGHTLTIDMAQGVNFWIVNAQDKDVAGTILVKGGTAYFCKARSSLSNVSYVVKNGGALNINYYGTNAFAMNTLTVEAGGAIAGNANNIINVSGAARIPAAFAFPGTLNLGGGLTIDATDEPATVPTLASTLVFGHTTVVQVDLTGRGFRTGKDILTWSEQPANATFVPYGFSSSQRLRLEVSNTGISVKRGLTLLISSSALLP